MPKEKVKGVHFKEIDLPLNVWIKISKAEGGKFGFEYTKDSIEKHIKKLEIKEGDILVVHEDLKMALLTAKIDGVPDCKIIFTDDLDKIRKDEK